MKKDIIPKDSRYIPLTQQKYCCVPTCIQMIMLKHKIQLVPAELIGYYMGLIVPKNMIKLFWNIKTGPKPISGYGTQAGKKYNPNLVFKKLDIPLKMEWNLINKFKDIKEFNLYLSETETQNKDILVCYDYPTLFKPKEKEHWGHVCVLDKVFIETNEVRIIDPGANSPKWKTIKTIKLFEAMKFHGQEKSGGFWELNLIK